MLRERFGPGLKPSDITPRTSLRLEGGRPRQAEAHRDRLRAGLRALGDAGAWLDPALEQSWTWARARAGAAPLLALRLLADPATRTLHGQLEEIPEVPFPYTLQPMSHPLSPERANPLVPHKGCMGPWNRGVLAAARQAGAQDALLYWDDATVAETAIAVVGCLEGNRFLLPPEAGRVQSIAELWDLPRWADERGWEVAFAPISLQEALQGQLWCFNALRGLWPAQALRTPP